MGFVFLFLSAFFNLTKSYCSKRISGRVEGFSATVDMTLVRNVLCAVIGAVILAIMGTEAFALPPMGWLICLVAGIAIGTNYIVWVLSLKSGVYLLASTANSASFIVAALCGVLFFEESISWYKGIAIVLILLAILFMGRYQKEAQGKIKPVHLLLLFLVFLSAGVSSATEKWFTETFSDITPHAYTFYSLLISAVLLLIITFFIPREKSLKQRSQGIGKLFIWIAIMAICFYCVTYFKTKANGVPGMEATVLNPLYNGTLLVAGSLMAWLCFGEKPSRNSIVGVILVLISVILLGIEPKG